MSQMQKVVLVIEQTIEHRVRDEIDLDEVRAWLAMDLPQGTEPPEITPQLLAEFLTSHRDWHDQVQHIISEGDIARTEPMGEDLIRVEVVP